MFSPEHLPGPEDDEGDKSATEEADDNRRVPSILIPSPDHRKKKHDASGRKEYEAE